MSNIESILKEHSTKLNFQGQNLQSVKESVLKVTVPAVSGKPASMIGSPLSAAVYNNKKRSYASIIDECSSVRKKARVGETEARTKLNGNINTRDKSVLFVKPKALSEKTNDEIKESIKSVLNQKTDPVLGLKTTNSGQIIIQCKEEVSVDKIKEKLSSLNNEYDIRKVEKNWPKFVIAELDPDDCKNDSDFINLLKEKNSVFESSSELKLIKFFGSDKYKKALIECDIDTYKRAITLKQVVIGWCICPIYEKIDILRCYKCQSFGHISKDCTKETVCYICSGPHNSATCNETNYQCINCKNFNNDNYQNGVKLDVSHPCFTIKCPLYKNKLDKKRKKVQYYD